METQLSCCRRKNLHMLKHYRRLISMPIHSVAMQQAATNVSSSVHPALSHFSTLSCLQQLLISATKHAFELCTSSYTSDQLSNREQLCARNATKAYLQAT